MLLNRSCCSIFNEQVRAPSRAFRESAYLLYTIYSRLSIPFFNFFELFSIFIFSSLKLPKAGYYIFLYINEENEFLCVKTKRVLDGRYEIASKTHKNHEVKLKRPPVLKIKVASRGCRSCREAKTRKKRRSVPHPKALPSTTPPTTCP